MNTLNCTSPIRACVESTSFNIVFLFHLFGEPSGTHTNKKLVISAFDTDFSFLIFIGFKIRRSHLKCKKPLLTALAECFLKEN